MNWDEDIDFSVRKAVPKQGRRANLHASDNTEKILDKALDSIEDATIKSPLKIPKSGVWTDEGSKSSKNKGAMNIIEQERFQKQRKEDSDDDIPVIPDIDDLEEEIPDIPDVKKASVSINKAIYKELDSELSNIHAVQNPFGKLGDIDISILSKKLYPEKDVQDTDVEWTMDSLLESIISMENA